MRLFVTGATGALGRSALPALLAAGHEVRAVARDETKAELLAALGAEPARVDLFDRHAVVEAVTGAEVVVHLATNVPPLSKMALPPAWRTHNRLRTEATRNLLEAARVHAVPRFIKESITFTYPDRGAEWIDESVPPDDTVKLLRPTLDGERAVARFGAEHGRGVVLRFGLFYGPENRSTEEALSLAHARIGPIPGAPRGFVSSIHVDDAATAVVDALDAPSGVYNVVDDEPLTRRDYTDAFSEAFELPKLRITPTVAVRVVGGSGAKALTASQRVSNQRMRTTTGWAPVYPSAREGWVSVAATQAAKS